MSKIFLERDTVFETLWLADVSQKCLTVMRHFGWPGKADGDSLFQSAQAQNRPKIQPILRQMTSQKVSQCMRDTIITEAIDCLWLNAVTNTTHHSIVKWNWRGAIIKIEIGEDMGAKNSCFTFHVTVNEVAAHVDIMLQHRMELLSKCLM